MAIVVVFVVAVGMLGSSTGIGALLSGLILILLACLAPWASFKFLDFAGTSITSDWHRATNGATLAVMHQGRVTAQSVMRTVAPIVGGHAGAAAAVATARPPGGSPSGGPGPFLPPPLPPAGGGAGPTPPTGGTSSSAPLFPSTSAPPPPPPSSPAPPAPPTAPAASTPSRSHP